jgi:hypothetical protein
VQASQKRAVVDVPPQEHAVETITERQLADAKADLIVPDGILRPVVKDEVAEMGVGIKTTQIGLA